MQSATSASDSHILDGAIRRDAMPFAPSAIERRHGVEYLESAGFDYPLALFWGAYLAIGLGVLVAWLG